jgi:hypothetical protein
VDCACDYDLDFDFVEERRGEEMRADERRGSTMAGKRRERASRFISIC